MKTRWAYLASAVAMAFLAGFLVARGYVYTAIAFMVSAGWFMMMAARR